VTKKRKARASLFGGLTKKASLIGGALAVFGTVAGFLYNTGAQQADIRLEQQAHQKEIMAMIKRTSSVPAIAEMTKDHDKEITQLQNEVLALYSRCGQSK
jgi:hypothetical protein